MVRDLIPSGYDELLRDIKDRVRRAQHRAAFSVNRELVLLYWEIGRDILRRQREEGWGSFHERLRIRTLRRFAYACFQNRSNAPYRATACNRAAVRRPQAGVPGDEGLFRA